MDMLGLVGAGMEVVDGMHAGQSYGASSHVGRCWNTSRMRGDTVMIPDHISSHVRRTGEGRARIDRFSCKDNKTVRFEKAPVRCPCSRLSTLRDAPLTLKQCLPTVSQFNYVIVTVW